MHLFSAIWYLLHNSQIQLCNSTVVQNLVSKLYIPTTADILFFSSQEGTVESSERAAMIQQYLQELVQRASDTNLKGEALHKLWPSMFAEMVRDCVLEMRDRAAFRQASLAKISETKWRGPKVHS